MAALYQLAWEDTFGGTALDRAKWNVRIGNWSISEDGTPLAPGWGNNEQQYYRDDAQNLFVGNDRLTIRALRQTSPVQFGQRVPYTSAKIDTRGLFSFCYGKVEFRARCPLGTGLWPAVWMMPEDHVYGPWARSGEIGGNGALPRSCLWYDPLWRSAAKQDRAKSFLSASDRHNNS